MSSCRQHQREREREREREVLIIGGKAAVLKYIKLLSANQFKEFCNHGY